MLVHRDESPCAPSFYSRTHDGAATAAEGGKQDNARGVFPSHSD